MKEITISIPYDLWAVYVADRLLNSDEPLRLKMEDVVEAISDEVVTFLEEKTKGLAYLKALLEDGESKAA